jgi:hypothetical protein
MKPPERELMDKRIRVEQLRADAERVRGLEEIAKLQRNIEGLRVAAAEGELLEAQLDLALHEHGYDYPRGIRGWRDLLSHHDHLKVRAELRKDALELIKMALSPEKPLSLETIVVGLHKIIETWENDENDL